MAALPDEVAATIAKAHITPDEREHHDPLIKRVFVKLAKLLAQATETDELQPESEDEQADSNETTTCNETACNSQHAYGYPPAYGVPANVAVQLLYDAAKLLEKVLEEVSDDDLKNEITELRERIAQALGISAQEFVAPVDAFREMRLAVTVSLGTQPVLPSTQAAGRLKSAWDGFVQTVMQGEYALPVGRMFDAVFSLRAAVEIAVKSLSALGVVPELQEVQTAVEAAENNARGDQDAEQVSEMANSDQAISAEGQPEETTLKASASGSNELAASPLQEGKPEINNNIVSIIQETIAPIVDRIEELVQRIEAVESAIKTRRRVSSFVASSRKEEENSDDLWRRWLKASESERRILLREAQKLLAAPVPFDRD
jgi:hypothetical protein